MKPLLVAILIALVTAFVTDIIADVNEFTSPILAVFPELPRVMPPGNG